MATIAMPIHSLVLVSMCVLFCSLDERDNVLNVVASAMRRETNARQKFFHAVARYAQQTGSFFFGDELRGGHTASSESFAMSSIRTNADKLMP